MTQLAVDFASFAHVGITEAGHALRSALSGNESDLLKQYGHVANENAMELQGFAMGIRKSSQDMNEQEKLAIRTAIAFRALKDARGDKAATAGSSANLWANLTGSMTNFATKIGSVLMPAVDTGVKLVSAGIEWLSTQFEQSQGTISGLVEVVVADFGLVSAVVESLLMPAVAGGLKLLGGAFSWLSGQFGESITTVGGFIDKAVMGLHLLTAAVKNPAASFEVLKLKAVEVFLNIIEWIEVIPANFSRFVAYIGKNWSKLCVDLSSNMLTAVENILTNFSKIGKAIGEFLTHPTKGFPAVKFTPITDGFIKTADDLPKLIRPVLTDLSSEIATASKPIWDDFNKLQDEYHTPKIVAATPARDDSPTSSTALPEKAKKGKAEKEFAGAAEFGSKDAYDSLVRGMYGLPKSANANLENLSKQQVELLKKQLAQQAKRGPEPPPPQEVHF